MRRREERGGLCEADGPVGLSVDVQLGILLVRWPSG